MRLSCCPLPPYLSSAQTKGLVLLGVLMQGGDAVHDAVRQRVMEVCVFGVVCHLILVTTAVSLLEASGVRRQLWWCLHDDAGSNSILPVL